MFEGGYCPRINDNFIPWKSFSQVLGIISTFFENWDVKPCAPKPRLLVCAPSNAGVDEIMRRLIAFKKSSTNPRISCLKLVRVGLIAKVNPDVHEITVDRLIKSGKEPKKEGTLPEKY